MQNIYEESSSTMTMKERNKSVPSMLYLHELGVLKSNYHSRMKILKALVCDPGSTFSKAWTMTSKQRISYECDKFFLKRKHMIVCYCVNGLNNIPCKLYTLNKIIGKSKIKDALILEQPVYSMDDKDHEGWKSSILVLMSDDWLHRYDLETGHLLQSIYLRYRDHKFKNLDWDDHGYRIFTKSSKNRDADVVTTLASYSVFPIEFLGLCEIRKSSFGKDANDANLQGGILILNHGSGQSASVKLYNWDAIVNDNKIFSARLGNYCPHTESVPGVFPDGIPCNINIETVPPILFEVQTNGHHFQVGGRPWHYIIVPPKDIGIFKVFSFKTQRLLDNGCLESRNVHIEPATVTFHPDESSRVLMETANSLQMYEIKLSDAVHSIVDSFHISLGNYETNKRTTEYKTKTGRIVKKRVIVEEMIDDPYNETLLAVEYENELDIIYCLFDTGNGNLAVHLYGNRSGILLKTIPLPTYCYEGSQHALHADKDTIIHLCRTAPPHNSFICTLYKLSRVGSKETNCESTVRTRKSKRSTVTLSPFRYTRRKR